jgi:RNA polymerase sigma-B factor
VGLTAKQAPSLEDGRSAPGVRRDPASEDRRSRTHELFLSMLSTDSAEDRRSLMHTVIEMHLRTAYREAARFRNRGIPLEDLRQVAAKALTAAAQRYDVTSGHDFLSFAGPTIRGELRKHFRDHGWMIRPPRRVQELQTRIHLAQEELSATLCRSPRPSDIALHLDEPLESVIEALTSDGCYEPVSLDQPLGEDRGDTLGELLSCGDADFDLAETRMFVGPLVLQLPADDRDIVRLRFYEGLTQTEIGERIGMSQMQVSRRLARILSQLHHLVGEVDRS